MPSNDHVVFNVASAVLRGYLKERYEGETNPWKLTGISVSEPGAVANQLLTNGNYFTCYASRASHWLLSSKRLDAGAEEELETRRKLYAGLFDDAQKTRAHTKNAGRDQRGRIRVTNNDKARKRFFEEWVFPPTKNVDGGLRKALSLKESNESLPEALGQSAARMLDEVAFYRDLGNGENATARQHFGEVVDELYLLDCHRVLLPIWVYIQCRYASPLEQGLPLNLYNIDFWSAPSEKKHSVRTLVERICSAAGSEDSSYARELADEFKETALGLFDQCKKDAGDIESAYDEGNKNEDTPSVRELFEKSLEGDWAAPEWAAHRADLIGMILRATFVGLKPALERGFGERANPSTADELMQDELTLEGSVLGRGSGVVPLGVVVGGEDLPSQRLDLRAAVSDGVLYVLGREYDDGYWRSCAQRVNRALVAFQNEFGRLMLDPENSGGLLYRLCRHAEGYRPNAETSRRWLAPVGSTTPGYSTLRSIRSGGLDVAGLLQRSIAGELASCFDAPCDGSVSSYLKKTDKALRSALEKVRYILEREWRAQRESDYEKECARIAEADISAEERKQMEAEARRHRDVRPPSIWGDVLRRFVRVAEEYFENLFNLCNRDAGDAKGDRSPIDLLLDGLEGKYEEAHAHDPSLRLAFSRLRENWAAEREKSGIQSLSLEDLISQVNSSPQTNTVFSQMAEEARSHFLELPAPDVSGRHAVLYLERGELWLADAGSFHGTAVVRGSQRAFVLEGAKKTKVDELCAASWMPEEREVVPAVRLQRGDVVRLAGETAVIVGNRL